MSVIVVGRLQGRLIAIVTTLLALTSSLWDLAAGQMRPVRRVSPLKRCSIAKRSS